MTRVIASLCALAVSTVAVVAADQTDKSGAGTFVSFNDGTLTIKGKTGHFVYKQVGANYKAYQNNENGPGSKAVDTVEALGRAVPGTLFQVDVESREISFGLDHRVIGTFESFKDGKLELLAAEAPQGFIKKPTGKVALTIDPSIPVLESVNGGDNKFVGLAGEVLKTAKKGTLVTARSEFDPGSIEVIQLGDPKRKIERYIGQTRGTVRGTFVSFKDGVLRIRGKGIASSAPNEYERAMGSRIADHVPIVESIDGGAYQPAGADALKTLKEGAIITIRKVEEVVLEVRIGVAKKE